jgi:hypothetical protein
MTALLLFVAAALSGFGLLCAGVWMLYGLPWALLAGSASMFCIAGFIRRGMTSG